MRRTARKNDESCLAIQKETLDRPSLQSQLKISRGGLSTDLLNLGDEEVPLSEALLSTFVPSELLPDPEDPEDDITEKTEEAPELLSAEEASELEEQLRIQDSLFPNEFVVLNKQDNLPIAWASVSVNEGAIILGYDKLNCGFIALSSDCLSKNCVFLSTKRAPRFPLEKNNFYPVEHDNLSTLSPGKRERRSRSWLRVCLGKF